MMVVESGYVAMSLDHFMTLGRDQVRCLDLEQMLVLLQLVLSTRISLELGWLRRE